MAKKPMMTNTPSGDVSTHATQTRSTPAESKAARMADLNS